MNKWMTVIGHEYRRHVLRKGFLVAMLSVPIWILVSVAAGFLAVIMTNNATPVGYVDSSGLLTNAVQPANTDKLKLLKDAPMVAYATAEQARAALEKKEIQAYFVIPQDYFQSGKVESFYLEKSPDDRVYQAFRAFLRLNLLKNIDPQISKRIIAGPDVIIQATTEDRSSNNILFRIVAPIIGAVLLITAVFTSSGYLMQAVVDEKENRTIEILATSLTPTQIMGGKIIALIMVGLTQVAAWVVFGVVGLMIAKASIPGFQSVSIDGGLILTVVLLILPTFVMVSAMMAAIGATVTESREAQQVSGFMVLPVMLPFMLISAIGANPNGAISLILTFFPLTSSLTIMLRMAFGTVPDWQMIVCIAVLIAGSVFSLWAAGRIFRFGMLRYGKRLSLRDVVEALGKAK